MSDAYDDCTTVLRTKHGDTDRIHSKVGVKQGDPLSPLLFNLALDPLLYMLEDKGVGFKVGDQSLTALAFADDLVLLSDSYKGMERNLQILEIFSGLTGLKVSRDSDEEWTHLSSREVDPSSLGTRTRGLIQEDRRGFWGTRFEGGSFVYTPASRCSSQTGSHFLISILQFNLLNFLFCPLLMMLLCYKTALMVRRKRHGSGKVVLNRSLACGSTLMAGRSAPALSFMF
ncbi:uncharacterized protein AKAME5_002232600 [Lates japonicus]|uniref:Reverse transcriptase domain-containing protein n=1 Tax=Lates japonicus TaxID=270547 RepID=A0AAD3NDL5_LATJO|nr:uncharacterized protein AKAME5_002232600 [Lates japonicus]